MINTEVYTYTYKQIFEGITQINYVQLQSNSYNALNNNYNVPLLDKYGNLGSYLYANKNIQENIDNNTINGTNLFTLKTENGILMFLNAPNSFYFPSDLKTISKPIYASGYYFGKNIEIIVEVLNDEEQTRKISVVFL